MKAFFNKLLNILWYVWLITEIADHSNTVGIQILALIVFLLQGAVDIWLMTRKAQVA